jgi:hypothetical protein
MPKVYDYHCRACDIVEEHIVWPDEDQKCSHCDGEVVRRMPAPRLSENSMWLADMPGATEKWNKARAEKQARQKRSKEEHGSYSSQSSVWDNTIPDGYQRVNWRGARA